MTPTADAAGARALVVCADAALAALIQEWLEAIGCDVASGDGELAARDGFDFIVLDVPYARRDGLEQVQRVALRHPGTPILALSSSFFAGVHCNGAVARSLGAAAVLPKPLARESLLAAVRRVVPPPA